MDNNTRLSTKMGRTITPKKIIIPIFNRATLARCGSVVRELSLRQQYEVVLVVSNSLLWKEFDASAEYIKANSDRIRVENIELNYKPSLDGMSRTAGEITSRFSEFFTKERPDLVIAIADRFETLPMATAAAYLNIPLAHIQGGEVTNNIDDRVRHAVTKLSDYHFCCTRLAKQYLIAMGEDDSRVFHFGCPSLDIIKDIGIQRKGKASYKRSEIICIFHPETDNVEDAYHQTEIVIKAVMEFCLTYSCTVQWYMPNPDPGRTEIIELLDNALKRFDPVMKKAPNLSPTDFLRSLNRCSVIVGNTSCIFREASYLGVPAVNIGDRQGLRERSWNVYDADYEHNEIIEAMKIQMNKKAFKRSFLYGAGQAGFNIASQIDALQLSRKPSLSYPLWVDYRGDHFQMKRYRKHKLRKTDNTKLIPPIKITLKNKRIFDKVTDKEIVFK